MDKSLRIKLIKLAKSYVKNDDPSHDFQHSLRVLANAERISKIEKADLDILVPACLFHDVINHPKNSSLAQFSSNESAEFTKKILSNMKEFPKNKIKDVYTAIQSCSFNKGILPDLLEAKILQDADGLEATGAISIMRTYASTGQMKNPFYHPTDPFCKNRKADAHAYALDLFFVRLLKIVERMHTKTARIIAKRRTKFLQYFLEEFSLELKGK
ncbi:MAG: HD domain-containing protein [Candidatus Absconditicoccaceae bacterium]